MIDLVHRCIPRLPGLHDKPDVEQVVDVPVDCRPIGIGEAGDVGRVVIAIGVGEEREQNARLRVVAEDVDHDTSLRTDCVNVFSFGGAHHRSVYAPEGITLSSKSALLLQENNILMKFWFVIPCGDSQMVTNQELRVKIMWYLARNNVTGGHNRTVDTVKNRAGVPTHAQGDVEDAIRDPDAPVEAYGGQRDAIRLTSISAAVDYIEDHGGGVPFGLG